MTVKIKRFFYVHIYAFFMFTFFYAYVKCIRNTYYGGRTVFTDFFRLLRHFT